jgi:predicted metal-dependent HD superfamily phosphohydrolase
MLLASSPPLALHDGWVDDLVARHTGGGRHYHTVQHLEEMLDAWATVPWEDPVASWVAVVLHDAVYVVGAADNEARSAALVPGWVARFAAEPVDVERVQRLILETARHGDHGPLDADTACFVDCDMAILAAGPERFAAYEAQVRREWEPVVGSAAYEVGRRRFFAGVVGRRVFQSERFAGLEARAQANLAAQR